MDTQMYQVQFVNVRHFIEDAMQIMGKLKSMSGEDSLPTWWTNKLAVASNSMNKIRDYLLVPSMQEKDMMTLKN